MLGILIGGLFTFAFGGLLLIVVLGARRIEEEMEARAREERQLRAEAVRIPSFIVTHPPAGAGIGRLDEAVIARLQQYLEAEQTLADQFVTQPSIESLYRESGRRLTVH